MKKTIFNTTALKKAAKKQPLLFSKKDNKVIVWNQSGTFCLSLSALLFTTEIQNNLPTEERPFPECIQKTFEMFTRDTGPMIDTILVIDFREGKTGR